MYPLFYNLKYIICKSVVKSYGNYMREKGFCTAHFKLFKSLADGKLTVNCRKGNDKWT